MERLILTIAIISGGVLLILITMIRYQAPVYFYVNDNLPNHGNTYSVNHNAKLDTIAITASDLPNQVQKVIAMDSLINKLQITKVDRISNQNVDYFDVCFLDTDNFMIMVLYDKNGTIINQFN